MDHETERMLHRVLDIQEKQVEMSLTISQAIITMMGMMGKELTDAQRKELVKASAMLERQLKELRGELTKR